MPGNPHSETARRPNILLVMCDDLGWGHYNESAMSESPDSEGTFSELEAKPQSLRL